MVAFYIPISGFILDIAVPSAIDDVEVAVSVSDAREQEAAVALITVGGKTDDVQEIHTSNIDPCNYQVHMDSDNLYIVLPSMANKEQE